VPPASPGCGGTLSGQPPTAAPRSLARQVAASHQRPATCAGELPCRLSARARGRHSPPRAVCSGSVPRGAGTTSNRAEPGRCWRQGTRGGGGATAGTSQLWVQLSARPTWVVSSDQDHHGTAAGAQGVVAWGPCAVRVLPCFALHPWCQHRSGCRHHRCAARHASAREQAGVGRLQMVQTRSLSLSQSGLVASGARDPSALPPACSSGAAPGWVSGRSQLALTPPPADHAQPEAPIRRVGVSGPGPPSQPLLPQVCGVPGLLSQCGWEGRRPRGRTSAPRYHCRAEGAFPSPPRLPRSGGAGLGVTLMLFGAQRERVLFAVS